jgi:UDP-N-acetylmuramoylalanine--D-glutamate ligase
MKPLDAYRDKRVVVLGLARSGVAAARLFRRIGARVTANDQNRARSVPKPTNWRLWAFLLCAGGIRTI